MGVRFEILGPVRAYRDAAPVDLGPVKQQALLALLLLREGRPVPVPEIVTALWSGDPPPNATEAVYRFIGNLRRALGPSLIVRTDAGYALHPDEGAVDAHAFRAAATTGDTSRALSLWHGDPLSGLTGPFFQAARAGLVAERARLPLDPTRAEPAPPPARVEPAPPPARVESASPPANPARAAPASPLARAEPASPPANPARADSAPLRVDRTRVEPASRHVGRSRVESGPLPVDPVRADPAPSRVDRTRVESASPSDGRARVEPGSPRVDRTRVESASPRDDRARVEPSPPGVDRTRVDSASPPADRTRVEPAPVREAGDGESHYGEPVDPWDGHDLFPPDPGRII
ncbi:winged helix-turn-helix domain-containing protein [Actinoplanes sp. CA-054009]